MFEKKIPIENLQAEIVRLKKELEICVAKTQLSQGDDALKNRIVELEEQVKALLEVNEEHKEDSSAQGLITRMRSTLIKLKAKLVRQEQTIKELTAEPLPFAVVVQVQAENYSEMDPLEMFQTNTPVKISRNSKFYGQHEGVGIIQGGNSYGWVNVLFEDGKENNYRIGLPDVDNGICDIELANKSISDYPTAVVYFQNQFMQVLMPESRDIAITPGDTVKISSKNIQITGVVGRFKSGEVCIVKSIVDDQHCEIDSAGNPLIVFRGTFVADTLEEGDRIILDSSKSVIIENLGKDSKRFTLDTNVQINWADIGGLQEAKNQMIEAIEMPFTNAKVYKFYNKKPIKGILLYGPPGCGKTLLAKAAVTALARMYKVSSTQALQSGYIYIKGPEILTKWVGESESIVRQIFIRARKHKEKNGYPAVIFIDEAEAILRKRGSGVSSDIESTIVPMFLAEMDGLDDTGAIVILATNRPDILDPAVVRDGRVDRKIKITRPDQKSAIDIFKIHLKGLPLNNGYSHDELADIASSRLFSKDLKFYDLFVEGGQTIPFLLSNIVNGGMIASIVDQATSFSIRRDLENPKKKCSGLSKDDLLRAIDFVYQQNRDLNHDDDIKDLVENTGVRLRDIKKTLFVQHQMQ
jgi:proteasome-associated ATPase